MQPSNNHKSRDIVDIHITLVKLKGPNYLWCAKVVRVYIRENGKLQHLVEDPPLGNLKFLMTRNKMTSWL